ncbi:hypothetical protein [Bartonella sp. ML70XJBT.G]|nr:hypothetical protein [Bartonella sp. ML70XJBT.G]
MSPSLRFLALTIEITVDDTLINALAALWVSFIVATFYEGYHIVIS